MECISKFKSLVIYGGIFLFLLLPFFAVGERVILKRYNEAIYLISNYSGIDSRQRETRSVEDLLRQNVSGFRFHLDWDNNTHQLVLVNARNQAEPFSTYLKIIRDYLDNNPDRILTLFLDFNVNGNELAQVVSQSGLQNYLYIHDQQDEWPIVNDMIYSGKRLVIFSMQEHRNAPDWLNYIWDYAVEPYFSALESPGFSGDYLRGEPRNSLLIYNNFNNLNSSGRNFYDMNHNPYLIEHVKSIWKSTGKSPSFIFLDQYGSWISGILYQLRSFKTIIGIASFNSNLLNYVSWDGMNSLTDGNFNFPLGPGESIVLTPRSPGYKFKPETVTFSEPEYSQNQHFVAQPLDITEGLQAFYNFENGCQDMSRNNFHGKGNGAEYRRDSIRGIICWFDGKSHIVLPKADELKLWDHDFTVAAWVKIDEYVSGKRNYCIIGTLGGSYQQAIHLLIRERKPYFGFFLNDLQGNTRIEAGRWYHLVWRYTKLNGEQAIYVNGKLDSRSLGHPSYKGRDNIYVGLSSYDALANMIGGIDDLAIWSRPLGEEEIWSLSKDVSNLIGKTGIFYRYPLLSKLGVIGLSLIILYILFRKIPFKNFTFFNHDKLKNFNTITSDSYPETNYIKLFGDFKVVDKDGQNLTNQITPKIKQLFLLILISSFQGKKGISTKELNKNLWPDLSEQNAKNSRGVSIRKLRLILESLESIDIIFRADYWTIQFSGSVYCDYFQCLKMLNGNNDPSLDYFLDFFKIVQDGQIFKDESHSWLDAMKGDIGNGVVDTLITFLNMIDIEHDAEIVIKIANRILLTDPVNDQALSFKLKALVSQNNLNRARFAYEQYSELYKELYNEPLSMTFNDFLK